MNDKSKHVRIMILDSTTDANRAENAQNSVVFFYWLIFGFQQ